MRHYIVVARLFKLVAVPSLSVELVADFVVILERYRYVHWWFTVGSRFVSRIHLWHHFFAIDL